MHRGRGEYSECKKKYVFFNFVTRLAHNAYVPKLNDLKNVSLHVKSSISGLQIQKAYTAGGGGQAYFNFVVGTER